MKFIKRNVDLRLTCFLLWPAGLGGFGGGLVTCLCCCCLKRFRLRFGGLRLCRFPLDHLQLTAQFLMLTIEEREVQRDKKRLNCCFKPIKRFDLIFFCLLLSQTFTLLKTYFVSLLNWNPLLCSYRPDETAYFKILKLSPTSAELFFHYKITKNTRMPSFKQKRSLQSANFSYFFYPPALNAACCLTLKASSGICSSPRTTVNRLVCEAG